MTVHYWRNRLTSFDMISGHLYAGKIYCKQFVNAPMTDLWWDWSKAVFFSKGSGFILFIEEVLVLRQQWNKPWGQAYKQWCRYRIELIDSLSVKIVETNNLWNVWDSEWVCIIYLWRGLAARWLHSVIHSFHVVTSYFNLLNRTFCLSGKKKAFFEHYVQHQKHTNTCMN